MSSRWNTTDGFSLIEIIIATGLVCAAAAGLCGLVVSASDALLAARQRTHAVILARAKLEELLADPGILRSGGAGNDAVAAGGQADGDTNGLYVRHWSMVPSSFSGSVMVAMVDVRPAAGVRLHVRGVRMTTLARRRP